MNEQVYEDEIPIYPNWEVFLEVLEGKEYSFFQSKNKILKRKPRGCFPMLVPQRLSSPLWGQVVPDCILSAANHSHVK